MVGPSLRLGSQTPIYFYRPSAGPIGPLLVVDTFGYPERQTPSNMQGYCVSRNAVLCFSNLILRIAAVMLSDIQCMRDPNYTPRRRQCYAVKVACHGITSWM